MTSRGSRWFFLSAPAMATPLHPAASADPAASPKLAAGTLTFTSANTYSGGTTISGGAISIGDFATPLGSGPITMNNGSRLIQTSTSSNPLTNPITITSGAEVTFSFNNNSRLQSPVTGDSTTIIDISNDTTGALAGIPGGYLEFRRHGQADQRLGIAPRHQHERRQRKYKMEHRTGIAAGGEPDRIGHLQPRRTLRRCDQHAAGIQRRIGAASAQTYQVGNLNTNSTFGGTIINGAGSSSTTAVTNVLKIGSGTLTLTGNSTTGGSVSVTAGTIQIGNGGTTGSISGPLVIDDPGTVTFNRSDNLTYAGLINITSTAQGTGILNQNGTGILTLSNKSSLVPTLNVNQGTLALGANLEVAQLNVAATGKVDVVRQLDGDDLRVLAGHSHAAQEGL